MSVGHLLNRTFTHWREQTVSDGAGGQTSTWVDLGTVPGRASSPSPSERQTAAQEGVQISHVVYLTSDTPVTRGDRLVDGTLEVEVVSVVVPSVASHHAKATARQEPWVAPIS